MEDTKAFLARIRATASEQRASAVWQACGEDAATFGVGGLIVGASLGLVAMRGRPFGRGMVTGLGAGTGIGVALARCNERFVALQTFSGPQQDKK